MPIFVRNGGHHDPENMHESSKQKDISRSIGIEEFADKCAAKEHAESLQAANPGYRRRRVLFQLIRFIITLENTNCVDPSWIAAGSATASRNTRRTSYQKNRTSNKTRQKYKPKQRIHHLGTIVGRVPRHRSLSSPGRLHPPAPPPSFHPAST
jgi:hypothetical protein